MLEIKCLLQPFPSLLKILIPKRLLLIFILRVRLTCALMAHIKLSIFRNIFSGIEKTVIIFSILEKFFSKNRN